MIELKVAAIVDLNKAVPGKVPIYSPKEKHPTDLHTSQRDKAVQVLRRVGTKSRTRNDSRETRAGNNRTRFGRQRTRGEGEV